MMQYQKMAVRIAAVATAVSTGALLVDGSGIAAAERGPAALMSSVSEAIALRALSFYDLESDPTVFDASMRGAWNMPLSLCCSIDNNSLILHVDHQSEIFADRDSFANWWSHTDPTDPNPSMTGATDLIPADVYHLIITDLDQGGPHPGTVSGIELLHAGSTIDLGHNELNSPLFVFDHGLYPAIFTEIPGFTPLAGFHPVTFDPDGGGSDTGGSDTGGSDTGGSDTGDPTGFDFSAYISTLMSAFATVPVVIGDLFGFFFGDGPSLSGAQDIASDMATVLAPLMSGPALDALVVSIQDTFASFV